MFKSIDASSESRAMLPLLVFVWIFHIIVANPSVHAPWGQIQGVQEVTDDSKPYNAYYAIPYALPPTGQRRFTRPVPHPGVHNGHVFNASTPGPSCMQANNMQVFSFGPQDEDCLTLDVYTPASATKSGDLPVIVYIHGGGFINGGASIYRGASLSVKGVIVVTLQYRVGPFGFLSTGDAASVGNYGLWDQHMAIQWVNRNIKAFGGDVKRITLMGESAGSASVSFQVLYEGSKGLFQRIIMQSGSATSTWALNRNPVKTAYELAQTVGCKTSNQNNVAVVGCLRAAPASVLSNSTWPLVKDPVIAMTDFNFVPVVDGEFVKDDPKVLMSSPKFLERTGLKSVDCMVAVNSNEGGLQLVQAQMTDTAMGTSMMRSLADRTFYRDRFIPRLFDQYFGDSSSSMADVVNFEMTYPGISSPVIDLQKALDTGADPSIYVPTLEFGIGHSLLTSSKKTYLYLFDHTPTFPPHLLTGLIHGQDQYYAFGLRQFLKQSFNITSVLPEEDKLADTFTSLLTDFAKTGDPSPAVKGSIGGDWPQFTAADQKYFALSTKPSVMSYPYRRRLALWSRLLPEMMREWQIAKNVTTIQKQNVDGQRLPYVIG